MQHSKVNINLWKRLAQIAGAFAFVISMLLIVNYAQYKRLDPVETELINTLVQRLNSNPEDVQLREEIRTLDLLSRKAYFTTQWQVRTGGYLLLLSVVVLVLAMQMIRIHTSREVVVSEKENTFLEQKFARKWVSVSGVLLVLVALVFAILTHFDLSDSLSNKLLISNNNIPESTSLLKQAPETEESETVNEVAALSSQVTEIKDVQITNEKTTDLPEDNQGKDLAMDPQKEVVQQVIVTKDSVKKDLNQKAMTPVKKMAQYPTEQEIMLNHPSFRGAGGNGISGRKNIPVDWDGQSGKNVSWKVKIPLHGYNSPIIWGDKLFLSGANSSQREVYCLDRNTGSFLWTTQVSGIPGSPANAPKVTDDTGQAAPTLTTDGNRVFALFANGDLVALDMDGKQIWAKNMGSTGNHYGHASSLMLFQNILILQYDIKASPKIVGLSASTGEIIWETAHKVKISWASPIVVNTGNRFEIITVADPMVSSHDPKTGALNWELNCIFGEVGPSAAYADGVVYAVNEYARLVAIQLGESPEILWESDEYLSDVPSPVATKDLLFMATSYGVMVCYDAKSGEIVWEHEFDNGFYSSPMLVDGKIYLIDMAGIMHVMEAKNEFVLLGESPLGEKCMTTPTFAEGKIYIRGNEHLFCVDHE